MGNSKQRNGRNLIVQGSVLAIASLIVRLIGIVYRIPLTNIVGNEGMGYYGFAFEVYQILVILATNAVPVAVSKLTAARVARHEYKNAQAIFKCSIIFAAVLSGTLALFTFVGARWISMVMFSGASGSGSNSLCLCGDGGIQRLYPGTWKYGPDSLLTGC